MTRLISRLFPFADADRRAVEGPRRTHRAKGDAQADREALIGLFVD